MQIENMTHKTKHPAGPTLRAPDMARVLIVSDSYSDTERLKAGFQEAGGKPQRAPIA
jgi:hypothetical protein